MQTQSDTQLLRFVTEQFIKKRTSCEIYEWHYEISKEGKVIALHIEHDGDDCYAEDKCDGKRCIYELTPFEEGIITPILHKLKSR